jgi:hypothetical protein
VTAESELCGAYWIQSPRHHDLCVARVRDDGGHFFPITEDVLQTAVSKLTGGSSIDVVASFVLQNCETRPSRCAYFGEVRPEM